MTDPAPSRTSTAPGRSHFNGGAFRAHGFFDRDQRLDDAQAEERGSERRASGHDRVDELGALVLQRLAGLDLPAEDVAGADEQLDLAVAVGRDGAADRDAALEHPNALAVVEVVEHDAAPAADG